MYCFFVFNETEADDREAPVISNCPDPVMVRVAPGITEEVVTWIEPTATDNSGMVPTITQSHQPGDSFPVGETEVRYIFTDDIGNEALCTFLVTIGKLVTVFIMKYQFMVK